MNKRTNYWSIEEETLLLDLWSNETNMELVLAAFPTRNYGSLKTKAGTLDVVRPTEFWSEEEIDILKSTYAFNVENDEILRLLPNRTWSSIICRARRLKIRRNTVAKSKGIRERHIRNGRDASPENLAKIALKYKSKSKFYREDVSSYTAARKLGILDKICSHMVDDFKFNYPQTIMFEILKNIFPEETILYNDRKTLKGKEIDVYIPRLKIGFEYDGYRFHNTPEGKIKDAHKDSLCNDIGITLYRILETNTRFPIPTIIAQLNFLGFIFDESNLESINSKVNERYINLHDLPNLIAKYDSCKDFSRENLPIYEYIHRNKLSYLFDDIRKSTKPYSDELMISLLDSSTSWKEYRKISNTIRVKMSKSKNQSIINSLIKVNNYDKTTATIH